jgi:excisionase family DNA binding protein
MAGARYPLLLTVGEAAKLLGVGRSTLYEAVRSGDTCVPVVRVGKQWRVPLAAVERIVAGVQTEKVGGGRPLAHEAAPVPSGSCPRCGA